jgi:hypothetical protein
MYPISIFSGSNEYLIGESESLDKDSVKSRLPDVIQKCLSMSLLDYNESILSLSSPTIRIKDKELYYTLPYHETFTRDDYILYWFILYVCEHASEVYGTPEKMFVSWVYDMFDTITEQVEFVGEDVIYPGALWELEESDHEFREQYLFRVIEPIG